MTRGHARRRHGGQPRRPRRRSAPWSAGRSGRLTTPMSRQNTPRAHAGAQRLGAGLLGGEALGVAGGAVGLALGAGALDSVKTRWVKRSPKRSRRVLDAADVATGRSRCRGSCAPRSARAASISAAHAADGGVQADEDRLADQEVADVELDHLRDGGDRRDRLVVDAVAGVDLQAERGGLGGGGRAGARAGARPRRPRRRARRRSRRRCAARPPARRRRRPTLDLGRVGLDEQRDADAGVAQPRAPRARSQLWPPATSRPPSVVRSSRRSGTRQTACGRWRSAMASISSVTAISKFSGRPRSRQHGRQRRRCRRRRCGGGPRAGGR